MLSTHRLTGKPFGLKTPIHGLLPEASEETQELSSAPSSLEKEETFCMLAWNQILCQYSAMTAMVVKITSEQRHLVTKLSNLLHQEANVSPGFLEWWWVGAEMMKCKGNFQPAGWASVLQSLGVTGSSLTGDALTQYKHGASAYSWHKCTAESSGEEGGSHKQCYCLLAEVQTTRSQPSFYIQTVAWVSSDCSSVTRCPTHLYINIVPMGPELAGCYPLSTQDVYFAYSSKLHSSKCKLSQSKLWSL